MSGAFPGGEWIVAALFFVFVATTVAGALIAVGSRRIIRSVCGLAMCCIGLAGLFYFLHSPFLALMEILIYVGAVCVTIVFAVMLAEPDEPKGEERGRSRLWAVASVATGVLVLVGIGSLAFRADWPSRAPAEVDRSVEAIGVALLTTYSLSFEVISLVLLVAILGALAIARIGRQRE
ncbi:NADH-quinone oxidoreductase subunit J [Opitutales bacterium ASA1]|uniref:NADH-quinone oxidoreductase subunit J family protein n=1 Tax=Congregicoccus parvus TaxID=3081749 RepID=UPI002B2AC29B|nr:NADH-quinone oxidoreductase subunit J [Opitutales bacterium ASA1]